MNQDNPFLPYGDDSGKTVMRPSPGAARGSATVRLPAEPVIIPDIPPPVAPSAPVSGAAEKNAAIAQWHETTRNLLAHSENPLTDLLQPLLSLVAKLRKLPVHHAIAELQEQLVLEIKAANNLALQQGITQEHIRLASYAVCSLLDETILSTPWGAQSFWGNQTLLSLFHKEAWGGERFFLFLQQMSKQPAQHLHLLELYYLCLSLGFEGKYRVMQNGAHALENERNELYQLIQRLRGDFERDLSPRWRGIQQQGDPISRHVPSWVVLSVVAAMLLLMYMGFLLSISGISEPVFKQLMALGGERYDWRFPELPKPILPVATPPAPVAPPRVDRYKKLLADEIRQNMVEVVDDKTLRIRNSFDSGSDHIKPEFLAMLDKIAQELATESGHIWVIGHTDDTRMSNLRFPSNWALSLARAKNVADILLHNPQLASKVRVEGHADIEPLAPNDSINNRAVNRRVDILIRS